MPETKARPQANGSAAAGPVKLPAIDVARVEEIGHLLEAIVAENVELFVRKGQEYREEHRKATRRTLTVEEATQLAIAAVDDRPVEERAAAFQGQEGLYAYEQPDRRDLMMAAGAATAPAFVKACRRAVALIEMPTDVFWGALDSETLEDAIDEAAQELRKVELLEARARTTAALEHFGAQAGDAQGKGLALLWKAIMAALSQAITQLDDSAERLSSLIASPPGTDGANETSSEPASDAPSS